MGTRHLFQAVMATTLLVGISAGPTLATVGRRPVARPAAKAVARPVSASDTSALIKQAYVMMGTSEWQDAISLLCLALRNQRNNVLARRYLCYCLLQSGDARNTVAQLDALAQLNRAIPFDLAMRGEALMQLGEADKSVEALKSALGMDTSSGYVREKLIQALRDTGRYQEAASVCAEGYFATKQANVRQRYLAIFNDIQQQKAVLSERNPGVQMVVTSPQPMLIPPKPAKSASAGAKTAAAGKDAKATTDTDTEEDETPAPAPPPKKVVQSYR
jgi:tetratricopeptide (TPR) repeat protein